MPELKAHLVEKQIPISEAFEILIEHSGLTTGLSALAQRYPEAWDKFRKEYELRVQAMEDEYRARIMSIPEEDRPTFVEVELESIGSKSNPEKD